MSVSHRCGLLAARLLLLVVVCPAAAMTVQRSPGPGGSPPVLMLQGRIVDGDAKRLRRALAEGGFSAVVLNSPGGSLVEARDMAKLVHQLKVPVVVPDRAVCASACFMLFAAARDRVVEPGAMVGVHSASVAGGNETMDTLGVTTLMAREAAQYGVPASITGRMVTTAPGQMAWLSREDLQGMGARVVTAGARSGVRVTPGSGEGTRSDWTRGFEQGQQVGERGDCTPPGGIGNAADFRLGCASGQRSGGARVAAPSGGGEGGGKSDWTRGFEYGRGRGAGAACDKPEGGVVSASDWTLGCASGRKAAGS